MFARLAVPPRRAVAVALAVAALALAVAPSLRTADLAATDRVAGLATANDAWLDRLDGKYRQLFDGPNPNGGIMLVHILNYYDTYNTAYGVPDSDVDAVGTFYGATTFHGLNDAMWAKYQLGEFMKIDDPRTGAAAVVNPWRVNPILIGLDLPQASIEVLQARGATFILCNNALTIFSGLVAQARGLDPQAVYADMKANILPGVVLVPAMVIAIEKAQARGLTYHRQ